MDWTTAPIGYSVVSITQSLPSSEMRGYKLLILDGHEAHTCISLHAAQVAVVNKLDIVIMPSHSHLVQPFRLRSIWTTENPLCAAALTRYSASRILLPHDVPMVIKDAYNHAFTQANIK